jgi:hypothetical protein
MKIAGFELAEGARFQPGAKVDAFTVGTHLEELRRQFKGEITPEDVLNDARNPNSPLHPFFEWDDNLAAEQFRLNQARALIRSVVAVYTRPDLPAVRARAYSHVAERGAPHYRETSHALSQEKTRRLVLNRAWNELQAWKERYRHLSEFANLVEVIDALEPTPKAGSKRH